MSSTPPNLQQQVSDQADPMVRRSGRFNVQARKPPSSARPQKVKSPLQHDSSQTESGPQPTKAGRWRQEEKDSFVEAIQMYGKDWKSI